MIRIVDVTLRRGRLDILRDVNLTIAAGEIWALLGPNGSGKSTLLLGLLGLLRPTVGAIVRDGVAAAPRATGYVPQHTTLDDTLPTTVAEFVDTGLVGLRLTRAERRVRVIEALTAVGLPDRHDHQLRAHSDGQRQRILLARALARRPRLLVLDEPTAALDPRAASRFWNLLRMLHARTGATVLFATHDLTAAESWADHAALCVPGGVRSGPIGDTMTPAHLDAAFGPTLRTSGVGDGGDG